MFQKDPEKVTHGDGIPLFYTVHTINIPWYMRYCPDWLYRFLPSRLTGIQKGDPVMRPDALWHIAIKDQAQITYANHTHYCDIDGNPINIEK